jgi:hypothetical protein
VWRVDGRQFDHEGPIPVFTVHIQFLQAPNGTLSTGTTLDRRVEPAVA